MYWRKDGERAEREKYIKRKERKVEKEGKRIKEIYCSKKEGMYKEG